MAMGFRASRDQTRRHALSGALTLAGSVSTVAGSVVVGVAIDLRSYA
jgi:hypothetical protein